MADYKKLLIPIDFSEHSELAAKQGLSLAAIYKGTVYFLHVGDDAERSAQRLSKFLAHKIGYEMPVPVKKLVAQGAPATVILSAARKIGADAIIMGSRGVSGLRHLMQGSVSEKVLRQAHCPVLIIKKPKAVSSDSYVMPQIRDISGTFQVDKILVPLDFSPASKQAFYQALSFASHYNSTIYTLTVFEKKTKESSGNDDEEHTVVTLRGEKIKLWDAFPRLLNESGYDTSRLRIKRMLLPGDPFAKIESIVEKKEVDLVIMGTNGRTGFEHFLLGSVAEKVLRSLHCSVMTIRAGIR